MFDDPFFFAVEEVTDSGMAIPLAGADNALAARAAFEALVKGGYAHRHIVLRQRGRVVVEHLPGDLPISAGKY